MKDNNKGITLVSLMIYVISLLIALAILATVSSYFYSNFKDMDENVTNASEFDKFNVYFLEEIKHQDNEIKNILEDGRSIEFTSGNKFELIPDEKSVYMVSSDNNIKIANNINDCLFTSYKENSKTIIKVNLVIGNEEREIEYVLGYGNRYNDLGDEYDYIYDYPLLADGSWDSINRINRPLLLAGMKAVYWDENGNEINQDDYNFDPNKWYEYKVQDRTNYNWWNK